MVWGGEIVPFILEVHAGRSSRNMRRNEGIEMQRQVKGSQPPNHPDDGLGIKRKRKL